MLLRLLEALRSAILKRRDFVTYKDKNSRRPMAIHHRKRLFCGRRDIITGPPTMLRGDHGK